MNSQECFKKINNKLSRMNLEDFKKQRLHQDENEIFEIDFWCDAILAWIGKLEELENKRRLLALEKTVQAGGVAWYEYFKSCEALIDAYNKKLSLRLFADKLFSQPEIPAQEKPAEEIKQDATKPPLRLVQTCEDFKSVFEEEPYPIKNIGISYTRI